MNKVELQPYQTPKRQKCVSCDRQEKVEKRLVLWQDQQVVGDLELCGVCLEAMLKAIKGQEEGVVEWEFTKEGP